MISPADCNGTDKKAQVVFSVVTVSYNAAATIAETIDSVLSQDIENIEYIIVDGASSDDTVAIVNGYDDPRIKLVSEPDNGLYDAMNKGVSMATGKYVAILNSDDVYVDSGVLREVLQCFESSKAGAVVGNLYYFKENMTEKTRLYDCGDYTSKSQWKNGWHPPHPATFFAKSVYERYGTFDLSFPIAADYDFMFRVFYVHNVSLARIPRFLVAMREGGESTRDMSCYVRANREVLSVWKKYALNAPMCFALRKIATKIFFHVRSYILSF